MTKNQPHFHILTYLLCKKKSLIAITMHYCYISISKKNRLTFFEIGLNQLSYYLYIYYKKTNTLIEGGKYWKKCKLQVHFFFGRRPWNLLISNALSWETTFYHQVANSKSNVHNMYIRWRIIEVITSTFFKCENFVFQG